MNLLYGNHFVSKRIMSLRTYEASYMDDLASVNLVIIGSVNGEIAYMYSMHIYI